MRSLVAFLVYALLVCALFACAQFSFANPLYSSVLLESLYVANMQPDWTLLTPQSRWLELRDLNIARNSKKNLSSTLFETVLNRGYSTTPEFLKSFYQISFCLDGIDADLAAHLFFKVLKEKPALALKTLDETLDAENESRDQGTIACMNNVPEKNFRADAYFYFANLIQDIAKFPDNGPNAAGGALHEYLDYREKLAKNLVAFKRMESIVDLIDENQRTIF